MRAYRFFSKQYGLLAIGEQRMRISRIDKINDPFEWSAPITNEPQYQTAFQSMKADMSKDKGIICFSRTWHNPLMWAHYAERSEGLALGFDISEGHILPVRYRSSRVRCDWAKFKDNKEYAMKIMNKVISSKYKHWNYEEEVRFHVNLDHETAEDGHYSLDFAGHLTLREIVVGPLSGITRDDIEANLDNYNRPVRVTTTQLASSAFRVVAHSNTTV